MPSLFRWMFVALIATTAHAAVTWRQILQQPNPWYASAEARAVADCVIRYQTDAGGWPKNIDMTQPPSAAFLASTAMDERAATIDNGATHMQLRFLARVISVGGVTPEFRTAFERGFDYLLRAQYPNGGWPQYFPLQPGYYTHITFNDDAMVSVLELLRDASVGREPFAFVDADRRTRAADAVSRGIACILKCQIVVNGEKTVWCAQHDETTFAPAAARKYEHASLSGFESVRIVRFLMAIDSPSPEVIDAVASAIRWFERAKLTGIRIEHQPAPGSPYGFERIIVPDPDAPPLWARFYEIATNRPIFSGRDGVIHYTLAEIEPERRNGYRWYIDEPRALLEKHHPHWARKHLPSPATISAPHTTPPDTETS